MYYHYFIFFKYKIVVDKKPTFSVMTIKTTLRKYIKQKYIFVVA